MKAGKTYVYKSEEDKRAFIDGDSNNIGLDVNSDGEFHVAEIDYDGDAELSTGRYISSSEFKYFKLKENEMLKPDDMITVEMTALDAMRSRLVLGECIGDFTLYDAMGRALCLNSDSPVYFLGDIMDCKDWGEESRLTKSALTQFKNPRQDKIDELEATIKNATEELAKIKAGDL